MKKLLICLMILGGCSQVANLDGYPLAEKRWEETSLECVKDLRAGTAFLDSKKCEEREKAADELIRWGKTLYLAEKDRQK